MPSFIASVLLLSSLVLVSAAPQVLLQDTTAELRIPRPITSCPPGLYIAYNTCLSCPSGYSCTDGGMTPCPAGSHSHPGSSECGPCPEGFLCAGHPDPELIPDYQPRMKMHDAGPLPRAALLPNLSSSRKHSVEVEDDEVSEERGFDEADQLETMSALHKQKSGLCYHKGETRCPAQFGEGTDCINVMTDLESCGGCSIPDTFGYADGVDCTALDGVDQVQCIRGACHIKTCVKGYHVGHDLHNLNHMECIKN